MTLSMHQACVPVFVHTLKSLSAILEKTQLEVAAGRQNEQDLMQARLAPDMFALPRQIQVATDMAKGAVARLAGQEPPAWVDEEATLAELRERLSRTVAFLGTIPAADVDGSEDRDIHLSFRNGQTLDFKGRAYLLHFVVPNFFFHAATAYDILRHKGVPLVKRDFIGEF